MGFTLKSAIWRGQLATQRQRDDLAAQAVVVRNAMNADKAGFKEFMQELEDGD